MKLNSKITLIAVVPALIAVAVALGTVLWQHRHLQRQTESTLRAQAREEAAKIAQSVYSMCAGTEQRNEKRLKHNLGVAHLLLAEAGGAHFSDETVTWQAINQFSKEQSEVALPKMLVGTNWLGQTTSTNEEVAIVDRAKRLTRDFCTIFQRMNEQGDMMRVATSVVKADGTRAIGTYIPAQNADGSANEVVKTVLGGETFRGRAFVVDQWHATTYEPIWDADQKQVVGMLYIGIGLDAISKELHDSITRLVVGKTGYVFVVGSQGDQRGRYIVSYQGKRDGETIWDAKDASGRLFIQSLVDKGLKTQNGAVDFELYTWKNEGEKVARDKFAAVTCFAPWDWIIGASAYEDDFTAMLAEVKKVEHSMLIWVGLIALGVTLVAGGAGFSLANRIARPILQVIDGLKVSAAEVAGAVRQLTHSSHALAEGASEQAASLEETSASLEEMASMTQSNTETADQVKHLANASRVAGDAGAGDMQNLSGAMADIQRANDELSKIVKTIDEIAFQTNILALNAAVEAARAGEAGTGFAVVADEVRNLAQRAANAAKESSGKICHSLETSQRGVQISGQVGARLEEIASKARQVDELAGKVAEASREQSQGITQITTAVSQMDTVTQANAATAEESASVVKELDVQAESLEKAVGHLVAFVGSGSDSSSHASSTATASPANKAGSEHVQTSALSPERNRAKSPKSPAVKTRTTSPRSSELPGGSGRSRKPAALEEGSFKDF